MSRIPALCALVALLVLQSLTSAAAVPNGRTFFVSPSGNDSWSGSLASPNAARTDGPFATLTQAQAAERAAIAKGAHGVTVILRGGTYRLDAPFTLTTADSGTAVTPTVYAAYHGESPIVSGGIALHGWTRTSSGAWQMEVPQQLSSQIVWGPGGLYVNGHRRERPRLPRTGYFTVAQTVPASPAAAGKGFDRIGYSPGDINPNWANLNDVEVLLFQIWTMARFKIASVDDSTHVLTWSGHTIGNQSYEGVGQGQRYLIENVKEALSVPGTYYYDSPTRTLTYLPMPGESPKTAQIVAPCLEHIVDFTGDPQSSSPVHDVVLRGLTFSHSGWQTPAQGHSMWQAEIDISGAVTMSDSIHCTLENCRIDHTGGWAIDVGDNCSNIDIRGCDLLDLGAGGVKIGGEETTHDVTVENTNIAHGGRIHPAATGVWIGHSSNNRIVHNTISDLYEIGISVGWTWGYAPSQANHNLISYNRIEHLGQGVLSDMGGIYTLGVAPGTVLDHNWISDVVSYDYGGWGIYFDEGSTGVVASNNIVDGVKSAGLHQNYGKDNVLVNNIFAYGDVGQLERTRAEDHLSLTFTRNIVLYKQGQLLVGDWSGSQYKFSNNLYWNESGPVTFGTQKLADRQASGQDVGSRVTDPGFADPQHSNFTLRPDSAAIDIGFVPIDMTGVGSGRALDPYSDPPAFPVGFSSH